jgi:signal peptidase I
MSSPKRWFNAVLAAFLIIIVLSAWILFAPLQLGGQATYVMVNGNSMEPAYHLGDLVIVRQVPIYNVGDIVVYRSAELNSFVFHRIIGTNLDHFIFKGDNNSWTDSYQPTMKELVGKLWIYIPKAGRIVQWLRLPTMMAILAGAVGIVLMVAIFMGRSKPGRKKLRISGSEWLNSMKKRSFRDLVTGFTQRLHSKPFSRQKSGDIVPKTNELIPVQSNQTRSWSGMIEGMFFVLGLVAFASLVMGGFAFTRSVFQSVTDNIKYQQLGVFSYDTTAPAGVYDTTSVTSGDPLFPKLNCVVNLQFMYNMLGNQSQILSGTHELTATILDDLSGWQRTIPLETKTVFSGNSFVSNSSINLCLIEEIVATMESATDLNQTSYSLIVDPRVTITGQMAGRDLSTTFEPKLLFLFDKVHFYLFKNDMVTDPLNPSEDGLIVGTSTQPNVFHLLGISLEVGKLRTVSVIGLSVSLLGLVLVGLFISYKVRNSKDALVQMKYASMMVDIHESSLELSAPSIDVVTMDDLAKLAERHNSLILHETHGLTHQYLVQGDRITYRYIADDSGSNSPEVMSMKQLDDSLREGIERGEFQVYYQPIVSLTDGKITTVEALLRWQHPERGLISAAEFISNAERTGLIDQIGEWMLQVACSQFKEWQTAGMKIGLAINLSEYQLERDPSEIIARVLKNTGVDPRTLQIEISEANIIKNMSTAISSLNKLTDLGIQISMDNMAGQSSLLSMEQFPINSMKIDRLVIEKISNPEDATMISAMITKGINMGLNVVAEGVETEEQLEFLRSHMCTQAQGYLLGRPAPAAEVTLLLEKSRNAHPSKGVKKQPRTKEANK